MDFTKTQRLLHLVPWLQSSLAGVSYEQICEAFGVSAKTAKRMLDDVRVAFPGGLEEVRGAADGKKRWRMRSGKAQGFPVSLTAEDLTALETTHSICEQDGRSDLADSLRKVRLVVENVMRHNERAKALGQDAEDLAAAEGLIMRPGPKLRVDPAVIHVLRECTLKYERVRMDYAHKGERMVEPYGFLYGKRHYLVAYNAGKKETAPALFALTEIHEARPTGETFEARKAFDLREYAERSFGVFQGDTVSVAWRFSPSAAPDARNYIFHPNQKFEEAADGSLIVRFTASGQLEMAHHLLTWGGEVEVLEPRALRDLVVDLGRKAIEAQDGAGGS